MKVRLQITTAPGSSFPFEHQGSALRIGRDPDAELPLTGEAGQSVSWQHARIEAAAGQAYLSDLQSTNGTFVNDRRVEGPVALRTSDHIQLGHTGPLLKVVELDLSAHPPAPPPPVRPQ